MDALSDQPPVYNYDTLKQLAEELDRPAYTLITNPNSDPFYAGAPARRRWAEWFAALWDRFGFSDGVHLRRIHYRLVSVEEPILDINGKTYVNHDNCWSALKQASCDARYLGLVPIDAIVDQRTDDAVVRLSGYSEDARVDIEDPSTAWVRPASFAEIVRQPIARVSASSMTSGSLPRPPAYTFEPPSVPQRFHVEIWSEKSTVADVLLPLANEYGLNVVMGAGDMSVTQVHQFVERAIASERPVRLLYVSDFDKQGHNMPVPVARKIDFFNRTRNLGLDVRLIPSVLTHEQCIQYELPRIPIKDTVRGKENFEERFGEGQTELDALEAVRPGVLRQILVEAIERYYDHDIDERVSEAVDTFRDELTSVQSSIVERHAEEISELKGEQDQVDERSSSELRPIIDRCNEVIDRCNAELASVVERCNIEAAPIVEQHRVSSQEIADRFNETLGGIASELADEMPDPDEFDWPEPDEGDEPDDVLFDSTRDFVEQIDKFKNYGGELTVRKARKDKGKSQKRILTPMGQQ